MMPRLLRGVVTIIEGGDVKKMLRMSSVSSRQNCGDLEGIQMVQLPWLNGSRA